MQLHFIDRERLPERKLIQISRG